MWKSVNRGNFGRRNHLRYFQGRQTWSWSFKFFWHVSEKSKKWKSVNWGYWGRRIDLRYFQARQTWSWQFKIFWHMSEKSKIWKSLNRGNWGCRIDLRYFQTSKFFLRRKNTDTREKIQQGWKEQGWKEKGAPFRGGGAKRQIQGVSKRKKSFAAKRWIQGCYSSGSKEKWGRFLIQNFMC